MNFSNIKENII